MTDEEVMQKYKELEEWYGDSLANPEHEPRRFAYQVKVYEYYKNRNSNNS